ncbi:dUTP diphosphatase [candidate division KSB1 bacterium]|nr:dUTP diphosphatase [candidate division KSB1 bacterium]
MNVEDVNEIPDEYDDRLVMIWDRQKELTEKYYPIERENMCGLGLLPGLDAFTIHGTLSQEICKNYAWRITEELAEAYDAFRHSGKLVHAWEEMSDALHFLVELYILNSLTPEVVTKDIHNFAQQDMLGNLFKSEQTKVRSRSVLSIEYHIFNLVVTMGLAMNCLKQKPWKQTHILTDANRFENYLCALLPLWVKIAKAMDISAERAFEFYFKKSEVNKFRIRSQY